MLRSKAKSARQIANLQKIEKTYNFFKQAENYQRRFTIQEVCKATGYTSKTADSYRTKKWYWFLKEDGIMFYVEGLSPYTLKHFIIIHQQKIPLPVLEPEPLVIERVVEVPVIEERIIKVPVPIRPRAGIVLLCLVMAAGIGWITKIRKR